MTSLTQVLWGLQDLGHLSGYLCTIYHSNHKTVFHTEDRVTVPDQQDQETKILE